MLDVAIAGGGPGGLACAHAIRRALKDVNVKVFERAPEYRKQGAVVMLNVNGLRALEAIDATLEENMRHFAGPALRAIRMDKHGQHAFTTSATRSQDDEDKYGVKPFTLGWHEIRQVLYDALPSNTVEFGKKVIGVSDEGDHAQLTVEEEGTGDVTTVDARVVVGADGYYSQIRQYCLQDGPPQFAGGINWRARIPWREGLPFDCSNWFHDDVQDPNFQKRLFLIVPISKTDMVWNAYAPVPYLAAAGLEFDASSRAVRFSSLAGSDSAGTEDIRERVQAVFSDYCEFVHDVIDHTDPQLLTEHGLFLRDPSSLGEVWGRGNITLAGDAAHLTLPTGQGVNLAFEDAAVLGVKVMEGGLTQQVLRSYEAERGPRCRAVLMGLQGRPENNPELTDIIKTFTFKPIQCEARVSG